MAESINNDQIFIRKLKEIVLANIENDHFDVSELARESGFNNRVLSRRLKKLTGKSLSRFIRDIKLEKALEFLRDGIYTVADAGYKTGFNSPAYFTKCFHEYFGYSPGTVKRGDLTDSEFEKLTGKRIGRRSSGVFMQKMATYRSIIAILVVFIVSGVYLFFTKFQNPDWTNDLSSADGTISIAVMPFQNLTQDTIWNIWQEGIQGRFISNLANNSINKVKTQDIINTMLRVNGQDNYASISPSVMKNISRKIDAVFYVSGTITEADSITSVDAQLISSRTNEVIKSFKIEGFLDERDAFVVADTLSGRLINFLLISAIANEHKLFDVRRMDTESGLPWSAQEFRYCYYGNKALMKGDNELAISWYKKALAIDSNDFAPMIGLSSAYGNSGRLEESLKWVLKYYKMKDRWPVDQQLYASWAYAYSFEPPEEGINYLKQMQDLSGTHIKGYLLGYSYCKIKKYYEAIPEFENYLKMSDIFGKEFLENNWAFPHLAEAFNKTGQYGKERKIIRKWEKYNPDDISILHQKASLALSEGDSSAAWKYIELFMSGLRKNGNASEADVAEAVGRIYFDTGIMGKAEDYYRNALLLDPDNPVRLYRFACFLTETDRSLDEVPRLMDRAMEFAKNKVDYYNYLDQKGWGLYKQGKYSEALAIIEKAWNEAPFKLYTLNHHLELAKEAAIKQ